jgi:hypothetical protein
MFSTKIEYSKQAYNPKNINGKQYSEIVDGTFLILKLALSPSSQDRFEYLNNLIWKKPYLPGFSSEIGSGKGCEALEVPQKKY